METGPAFDADVQRGPAMIDETVNKMKSQDYTFHEWQDSGPLVPTAGRPCAS